jgi:radical SAM protein with 4Fe4S-binding SPASM domain
MRNLDKYISEVIFAKPVSAQIDVTNQCDFGCLFCYADTHDFVTKTLPRKVIFNIMDRLEEEDVMEISFSGGEPFLRNDFNRILEYASEKDFKIHILSNGTHLNDAIINILREINFIEICVNINGPPKIHDDIVQKEGSYDRTIAGLNQLRDVGLGDRISLGSMVMNENYLELSDLYNNLCSQYPRSKDYRILFPVPAGRGHLNRNGLSTSKKQFWIDTFHVIQRMKEIERIPIIVEYGLHAILCKIDPLFSLPEGDYLPLCNAGKRKMIISSNGSVIPCNFFREESFIGGNILDNDIETIWAHPNIEQFRIQIMDSIAQCDGCEMWTLCRGGCRAWSYHVGNDLWGRDPRCIWLQDHVNHEGSI